MATLTGLFTLGRDAEIKHTGSGTVVVHMNAAYNYGRKGDDGRKPTQWIRLAMFGRQAESLAPHLTKGKQVSLIVCDVHINTYTKQDGTEGVSLEGVADFDDFARGQAKQQDQGYGGNSQPARQPAPQRQAPPPQRAASGFEDGFEDVPF